MAIQQKIYMKIVAAIILVLMAGVLLFPFLLNELGKMSHDFNVKKSDLETILDKEIHLQNLIEDYDLVKDGVATLKDSFLSRDKAIDFIQDIENIAGQTGNVEEIRVLSSDLADDGVFKFQISLYGDFEALMDFLSMVENGKYQTRITRFNVSKLFSADIVGRIGDLPDIEEGDINTVLNIEVYTL